MIATNTIHYSSKGKSVYSGRIKFSIEWQAINDGDSADIKLSNLEQVEIKKFKQSTDEEETTVKFHNMSIDSNVSVWLTRSNVSVIKLYLSYPIDDEKVFQGIVAEWNVGHIEPHPIVENRHKNHSYSDISIDEWEAIFPLLCLHSLPLNENNLILDLNRYIQIKFLKKVELYNQLINKPETLQSFRETQKVVVDYIASNDFISNISSLDSPFPLFPDLLRPLKNLPIDATKSDIIEVLTNIAKGESTIRTMITCKTAEKIIGRCWSSIIALLLVVTKKNKYQCLMLNLIALLRVVYFLSKIFNQEVMDNSVESRRKKTNNSLEDDHKLNNMEEDYFLLLNATIVIPDRVIPVNDLILEDSKTVDKGWCRLVGIGDVRKIYQKTKSYALGDIAKITNLIAGETNSYSYESLESNQQNKSYKKELLDDQSLESISSLATELNNEVKNVIANDKLDLDANGLTPSYSNLGLVINGSSNTTWTESMTDALLAKQYAKNITDRASDNIKNKVADLRQNHQYTEIRRCSKSEVDNSTKEVPINAIYRWVDLIYHFEIRPCNRALIMEFLITKPADNFIKSILDLDGVPIIKPDDDKLFDDAGNYQQITRLNYLTYQAKFNAKSIPEPPPQSIEINIKKSNRESSVINGCIKIPVGYTVNAEGKLNVVVSNATMLFTGFAGSTDDISHSKKQAKELVLKKQINKAVAEVSDPVPAVYTNTFNAGIHRDVCFAFACHSAQFSIDISVVCEADMSNTSTYPQMFDAWQQEAFRKLQSAYQQQIIDYNQEYVSRLNQASDSRTRAVERKNIKIEALDVLTSGLNEHSSETLRFLERSLLWDEMAYQFFPWSAGEKPRFQTWYGQNTTPENNDLLFDAFLQAGSARVLIPINPRVVNEALFTILFNHVWNALPENSVATEQGALLLQSISEPLEQPDDLSNNEPLFCWSERIPTTHTYLQQESELFAIEPGITTH